MKSSCPCASELKSRRRVMSHVAACDHIPETVENTSSIIHNPTYIMQLHSEPRIRDRVGLGLPNRVRGVPTSNCRAQRDCVAPERAS